MILYEKYMKKLWSDLKTDIEKYEFIRCGRAWETGIIAKELEWEISDLYLRKTLRHLDNSELALATRIQVMMGLKDISLDSSLYEFLSAIEVNLNELKNMKSKINRLESLSAHLIPLGVNK